MMVMVLDKTQASAALWLLLGFLPCVAVADEIKVGTAIDCSRGKYGQDTWTVVCMYPNYVQAFTGPYEFKLSIPYIDTRNQPGGKGFGDITLYAGRTVAEDMLGFDAIDLGVKMKARNGSVDRGLGNGRSGYAGGIALTTLVRDRHLLLAYFGATTGSRDDSRVGAYLNVWYKFLFNDHQRLGVLYENNELGYSKRIETLTLMPEFVFGGKWTVKPFVYRGLNSFAPSIGVGVATSYSFH